jgi:hypothetical protein
MIFELRPNFSHLSNAGLQKMNIGFIALNLGFELSLPLRAGLSF